MSLSDLLEPQKSEDSMDKEDKEEKEEHKEAVDEDDVFKSQHAVPEAVPLVE